MWILIWQELLELFLYEAFPELNQYRETNIFRKNDDTPEATIRPILNLPHL